LCGELEHLKIKTRLKDEMFVSVIGEYGFFKCVDGRGREKKIGEV